MPIAINVYKFKYDNDLWDLKKKMLIKMTTYESSVMTDL